MIQGTKVQGIRVRHVSSHRLEGPPKQETNVTEAIPCAIDKWAQDTAHQDKVEVGWPNWVVGRPPSRPTAQWAPPPQVCYVEEDHWSLKSVHQGSATEEAPVGRGSHL